MSPIKALKQVPSAVTLSGNLTVSADAGECGRISLFMHDGKVQGQVTMARVFSDFPAKWDESAEALVVLKNAICAALNGEPA